VLLVQVTGGLAPKHDDKNLADFHASRVTEMQRDMGDLHSIMQRFKAECSRDAGVHHLLQMLGYCTGALESSQGGKAAKRLKC